MSVRASLRAVLTAGLLLAAVAETAEAGTFQSATFNAAISGRYTRAGSVTNTGCYRVDGEGNRVPLPPLTAPSETTSFHSTRSSVLGASRTRGKRRIIALIWKLTLKRRG